MWTGFFLFNIMDVYEIKFTENYKVSLVKDPAIESTLLKFNNETTDVLHFTNDEKKIVYSVAMIPNKMIFRKDIKGKPANVFYSAETIKKFQQEYFKSNSGTNVNHAKFNTEGIYPFTSWVVNENQNSIVEGQDLKAPNDSLIMGFKIDNPEIWEEIKTGNLDGLSVEGNVIFEQQTNITMTKDKEGFWDYMKAYFATDKTPEEIKAEEEAAALKMAEEEASKNATPPAEDEPDLKEENEKLKEQVALLEEKLATIEAEKVKSETDLVTMKAEKEKAEADLIAFKNETPAVPAIPKVPKVEFKNEKDMTPLEKFRASKQN